MYELNEYQKQIAQQVKNGGAISSPASASAPAGRNMFQLTDEQRQIARQVAMSNESGLSTLLQRIQDDHSLVAEFLNGGEKTRVGFGRTRTALTRLQHNREALKRYQELLGESVTPAFSESVGQTLAGIEEVESGYNALYDAWRQSAQEEAAAEPEEDLKWWQRLLRGAEMTGTQVLSGAAVGSQNIINKYLNDSEYKNTGLDSELRRTVGLDAAAEERAAIEEERRAARAAAGEPTAATNRRMTHAADAARVQTAAEEAVTEAKAEINLPKADKFAEFGTRYADSVAEEFAREIEKMPLLAQTASGVGGMIPAIAANFLVPGSGSYAIYASAAQGATEEAMAAGAGESEALLYGTSVGVVELLVEKLVGGIPGVFKKGAVMDDVIDAAARRIFANNKAAQGAFVFLANMAGEGFEEFVTEYADAGANLLTVKTEDRSFGELSIDALQSFLVGGLVSGVMQGGNVILSGRLPSPAELAEDTVEAAAENAELAESDAENGATIRSQGLTGELASMAGSVGVPIEDVSVMSDRELGQTLREARQAVMEAAVNERIEELGGAPSVALAEAVMNRAEDRRLTAGQKRAWNGQKKIAAQVAGEYTAGARGEGTVQWYSRAQEESNLMTWKTGAGRETPAAVPAELPVVQAGAATYENAAPAEQIGDPAQQEAVPAEQSLREQTLERVVAIEGMSDSEAMQHFHEQYRQVNVARMNADAAGDVQTAQMYADVLELLNEAVRAEGNNMKAIAAYVKGALNHGGSVLHNGTDGRDAGAGAGIEAGRVRPGQDGADGRGEGLRRVDGVAAYQAPAQSAEELGIPNGAGEQLNRVLPEASYDAGMKKAAEEAAALGCRMRFVTGPIRIWNEAKELFQDVTGVAYGSEIVVRSDHRLYSAEQLAEHELMHIRMAQDPGLRQEAVEALVRRCSPQEVKALTAKYADGYGFVYGTYTENMSADEMAELEMKYLEEAICDAAAGINRSFGGRAGQRFGDVVQEVVRSRIGMGNGSGGMPGSRYSFAGERAHQADLEARAEAERMEERGVGAEDIRRETGWFRGNDGKWRFEIDDSGMTFDGGGNLRGAVDRRWAMEDMDSAREELFEALDAQGQEQVRAYNRAVIANDVREKNRLYSELVSSKQGEKFALYVDAMENARRRQGDSLGGRLADYLKHDELYANYPRLRDVELRFEKLEEGERGRYNPARDVISVDRDLVWQDPDTIHSVLIHEIQHAIQEREGFSGGASTEYWEGVQRGDSPVRRYDRDIRRAEETMERVLNKVPEDVAELFREYARVQDQDGQALELITRPEFGEYKAEFLDYAMALFSADQLSRNNPAIPARELYRNTAGEIEARETEKRLGLGAEERRAQAPDLGGDRAVFAEQAVVYSSEEIELTKAERESDRSDVLNKLRDAIPRLENSRVLSRSDPEGFKKGDKKYTEQAGEYYDSLGGKVYRPNFGQIIMDVRSAKSDLAHGLGRAKAATTSSVPDVLRNGIEIDYQENWKGRGYDTYIFAGKIMYGERPVYLAAIVRRDSENRLYLHEVLALNGEMIKIKSGPEHIKTGVTTRKSGITGGSEPFDISISDGVENSNTNFKLSADESIEAMPLSELRRAVREDEARLRTYEELARQGGLNDTARAEMARVRQRLEEERAVRDRKNAEYAADKQAARERERRRTAPTRAKRDLRKEVMDAMGTPMGLRGETGGVIDRFADLALKQGEVSYRDRKKLFDWLYGRGMMTMEALPYFADIRNGIAGTRVYVDENTRHAFGDKESYDTFRREAFANGVILTSDKGDYHVDTLRLDLDERFPGAFREDPKDQKEVLEEIVEIARQGKAENVSLAEMMSRVEDETGRSIDEQMEDLERRVDAAIDKFIEKARLETDLKARSAVEMAEEREARRKTTERQARARQMRDMQQKTMRSLQWLKKNELKLPGEIKTQAQELLDGLDLYAVQLADEMRWSEKHQATWRDLADMYQNARVNDPNFMPSPELEKIWARVNLKKVGELDLDALEDMYRAASVLRQEYYDRNNVLDSEDHLLFSEAYADSVKEIRTSGGKGKLGRFFNAEQLTPVNVLEMMGGWRREGSFFAFGRMLERGEREYKRYVVEAQRQLKDFIEEHQDWIARADGQGKDAVWYEIEVPELLELRMGDKPIFGETKKVYMTPAQKVHMYLESKNHQNLRHMAGGRTFVNRALYEQGKRSEAMAQGTTIRMAPETVKKLVSDLTEEEMALADALQKYYDVFASEQINRVSNILYGFDKAVTKNYAPIFSNRNYTKSEPGIFDVTAEGVGHMKGRVQYSANPSYNISAFDAWEKHIEQTGRFVGYSIPVRNVNRLMNWRADGSSMRDEITHVWGEEGAGYVENYIKELQSPQYQERSLIQEIGDKVLSNYISGVFGANPSVVLKQLLSFQMAGSVLDFKNLPAPAQIAGVDAELIAKYTPELEYRRMGYATPEVSQLKDNPNWTQRNKLFKFVFGGGAITWTDAGAAKALWPWAENYVRRHFPDLEAGSEAQIAAGQSPFYRKVAEVYNDAVTNTQSMSDISHRPEIMRRKDLARAFTMFKSDSAQAYNTIRRLCGELSRATKDGDKSKARDVRTKLAAGVTATILSQLGGEAVNFLMALWKNKAKWYRDDEEELTAESVAKEYASGLVQSMAGLVMGGEELMTFVLGLLNMSSWYGQNDVEVPGAEQLNDFLDAVRTGAQGVAAMIDGAFEVAGNDGDVGAYLKRNAGDFRGSIKEVAMTMAQYLAGAPVENVEKYLLGAVRWMAPDVAAAYENWFVTPEKGALSGLEGEALQETVGDVLYLRGLSADEETVREMARLYEAGERSAVPTNTPSHFSVDGADYEMNVAQGQRFEMVYAEAIGGNLDSLVESAAFIEADDETRAKMLDRLYSYASDTAKRTVNPDYKGDNWTRKAAEAQEEGLNVYAYVALQAQGLEKNAEKLSYIDGMDLSGEQKGLLWYYAVASEARMEDAQNMRGAGMGWDEVFEAVREYTRIDAMAGTAASIKAATFKSWAQNNLDAGEASATVESFGFSTGMRASTETYDKLTAAGLSADSALAMTTAWGELVPENGVSTVSDLQRMNAVIQTLDGRDEQMVALSSILDDANRWKLQRVARYDVDAEMYVEFRNAIAEYYDYDPNGSANSLSQAEATAALRSMGWLTIPQKAALWQIQTMGKNGTSNPFSTGIGLEVYLDYMNWKDSREEDEDEETDGLVVIAPEEENGGSTGRSLLLGGWSF